MIRLAPRLGTMVPPSERHVHTSPTPTAGGAAMILGVIVAAAIAALHPEFSEVMEARTAAGLSDYVRFRTTPRIVGIASTHQN